ncbi:tryptophan synthase subunit alpha [Kerstersia gyiorum]|uniref:tryptophan synthase subunit alpha n=1 Tax=Kerstersia gyiorum TaxID=206506 RepID=UPI00214FFFF9|nr:tryptophan synthase subunit alpha [Kerstersia gyiorum]MCR4160550.1 tryptophan synthase subunit alpha [Kerstersia gyiorum]
MQSNSRIDRAFARTREAGRAALIPYIPAGDPDAASIPALMHALVDAGADVIELGVPFSDPTADGPVIQLAAERAIAQGVGLRRTLEMVAEFRQRDQETPVVLMGYANPIERMGEAEFVRQAKAAGVDGVLTVDYPAEEIGELAQSLETAGIAPIFLLAPTSTEERIRSVARVARGYVYYVSLRGVTGAGGLDVAEVESRLSQIRRDVQIPIGVGFGIRDAATASRIGSFADAVVIGTKIIEVMQQALRDHAGDTQAAIQAVADWLRGIRRALDTARY